MNSTVETGESTIVADYMLDEQVGFLLRQAIQRHVAIFESTFGADLTPTQWAVLAKLDEIGATSQNRLGRATAMDVATIKGVVDRLADRGFVMTAPDPGDARRRVVSLTGQGAEEASSRIAAAHTVTEMTLAPLTAAERRTFLKILSKLV